MFIEFKAPKRLSVHATGKWDETEGCLSLKVTQAFFHCAKYIDPSHQMFVPDPERGYGVCVSGPAELFDGEVLQTEPFVRLPGAQRIVAIRPLYYQVQFWNDDLGPEFVSVPAQQMTC
jgi:hypothetical protein